MAGKRDKNRNKNANVERFRAALAGRTLPVLTLDNKWHQLFAKTGSTAEMKRLQNQLNELMKRQGKVNSEMKDIHRVKKKLMENIVASMEDTDEKTDKKMEESSRLIQECNDKMREYRLESETLPQEINEINLRLMVATMEVCYERMQENNRLIAEIGDWITKTRIELKKRLLRKQECEEVNNELYSYMHDIFGAEVIEIFDTKYYAAPKDTQKK